MWNEVKTMVNVPRHMKLTAIFSHFPSKKWIAVPEGWWQTSRRRAQAVYKPMSTSVQCFETDMTLPQLYLWCYRVCNKKLVQAGKLQVPSICWGENSETYQPSHVSWDITMIIPCEMYHDVHTVGMSLKERLTTETTGSTKLKKD
jgi:hypothetical protein